VANPQDRARATFDDPQRVDATPRRPILRIVTSTVAPTHDLLEPGILCCVTSTQTATPYPQGRAVLLLFLTAIIWSTSGILIKIIDWQPMSILAGRSALAIGVFLIYLRKEKFRLNRVILLGGVACCATQILYITATKMTTAANAIFLQYTGPIYVILLGAWFLHERPTRTDWFTLVLILAGLGFFFGEELSLDGQVGNLLAILSGVTMAVMTICLRAQKDAAPGQAILLAHVLGTIIGMPSMLRESFTVQNVAIMSYLGIVQIGIAFALYATAIKHVPALEATLIVTLEPILNPLWVFLVIGEAPGPLALLGGILVIGAVTARGFIRTQTGARTVGKRRRAVHT
jgi:drug/metabolite transporter (DMT)-like permease